MFNKNVQLNFHKILRIVVHIPVRFFKGAKQQNFGCLCWPRLTNWVRFLSELVQIIPVIHQEALWKALWKIDLTRLSMSNIHALLNECSSYLNFLIFPKHARDDDDDLCIYTVLKWMKMMIKKYIHKTLMNYLFFSIILNI